jgi:hypothetical protein
MKLEHSKQKKSNKMTTVSTCSSIITLSLNGLNSPNKTHRLAYWIEKQDPTTCWVKFIPRTK